MNEPLDGVVDSGTNIIAGVNSLISESCSLGSTVTILLGVRHGFGSGQFDLLYPVIITPKITNMFLYELGYDVL